MAIYLDYAAATPVDNRVAAAMQPYLHDRYFNPSAVYLAARHVHADIAEARASVARILGARPSEIIFTAGATEANNLALQGIMRQFPGKNMVLSAIEHESILALAALYPVAVAPVSADATLDTVALRQLIDEDTVLVSIMYTNNEVGTVQPLREVARMAQEIRAKRRQSGNTLPLYIHTDATQAANYLDLHVSRLGVDLMTLDGGKIYGPKQSGVLFMRSGVTMRPLLLGGGQERAIRSGTENVPGIIGFAKALEIAQDMREREVQRLRPLQQLFISLLEEQLPAVVINGSRNRRLPNNVHVTFPGQDNERLLMALDEACIMAAAGSACVASDEEPSHVLKAMGLSDSDARSSLRFTMGRQTSAQDIHTTVDFLHKLIA